MNLYEERQMPENEKVQPEEYDVNPYIDLTDVLNSYVDFDDSVIFFNDDIGERTIIDLMIRFRSLLKYRDSSEYKGSPEAPINLVLNSPGGEIHEMMGVIDYLNSIKPQVNIIVRGRAFSAAAVILASRTENPGCEEVPIVAVLSSCFAEHHPAKLLKGT